jgi:hypothetical protein
MYSLKTTFVLRLFKILSAPSPASALNIEKMAKKFKILQFFLYFFKSFGPNRTYIMACLTGLVNASEEKITVIEL